MSKNVLIIGGGVIGLMSAYYLLEAGHRVSVADQTTMTDGCSYGNAGLVAPSHVVPLASPGMISTAIRYMFSSTSPLYIKPRIDRNLITWAWNFYRFSTRKHVHYAVPHLKNISLLSKELYNDLTKNFDFGYKEAGLLMLFSTGRGEKMEVEAAALAQKEGVDAQILNAQEISERQGGLAIDAKGGVYYPGDVQLIPHRMMDVLKHFLTRHGVQFFTEQQIKGFKLDNGKIWKIDGLDLPGPFDEVVVAAGSWSPLILDGIGLNLPLQAGKGYSFMMENMGNSLRIPCVLKEARVALTPMENNLRIAGTMEIAGINHRVCMNRVKGIVGSVSAYYPDIVPDIPEKKDVWHGLRPCSADGLPFIGRSRKIKNLVIATGHAMMGITLAPATGKLVSEIISEKKVSIDIDAFSPDR